MEEEKKEEVQENIEDLKGKCEEYLNNWHTEKANFLNYQQNERQRFEGFAVLQEMSFLEELINVMGSFEISFKAMGECEDEKLKQMKEGFYLIYSQMENILKKHNVIKMDVLDKQFDPKMHESVETHLDPDKPEGLIVEEIQKGYMYKDIVLRPAKVKIIKNI